MTKPNFFIFAFIFGYFSLWCDDAWPFLREDRALSLGEQQSIPVDVGTKFSIGNPEVIQVKNVHLDDGRNLLVVRAKKLGDSDLVLLRDGGEARQFAFHIYSKKKGAVLRDVKAALGGSSDIEIMPNGEQWVVRGEAQSAEDHNLVDAFSKPSGKNVITLAKINPVARAIAEEKIRIQLQSAGLGQVKVRGAGSQIWLEGMLVSPGDAELALALAREVFRATESRLKVPFDADEVVRFKVRILELVKSNNDNIGMMWSTAVPGIISIHQKLMHGNFSLEATLNLLARRGFARILSEPTITVNSRGQAELKVGGEIPITVRTRSLQNVTWKEYGLSLKIEVPGSTNQLVRTKISVEVSSLDPSASLEGIPAIKLNRMDTIVDLETERTVFLSGLLQDQEGESESGLPWLARIPIFGALFRSKEYQNRKTELVIAITANQTKKTNKKG